MIAGLQLPTRYEYTGETLSGGMSDVHIYKDTLLDRLVAVKCMGQGGEPRRTHDELLALQSVTSKHVVNLYDYIKVTDLSQSVVLIEEYIDGVGLDEVASAAPINKDAFLRIALQLATGIADIHSSGQVHRDIKPHNAKLNSDGIVKIFDFGLTRKLDTSAAMTSGFVGTDGFAAPELYKPGSVGLEASVDAYAFASTLWFLHHQDIPIDHEDRCDLDFCDLPFDLPSFLYTALNECWSDVPPDRPKMSEVASLIERAMLKDMHSACLTDGSSTIFLNDLNPHYRKKNGSLGGIEIEYDGYWFNVVNVSGAVFINNRPCDVDRRIVGDCVITLGPFEATFNRLFITFDVSHPEFVI